MSLQKVDVAIIGMGPVGAAAALFLAHEGLSVVVFEKSEEVYDLPRAVALDGEIVRAFQRIGLGEELDAILQSVRPGERAGFANSKHEWLFGQQMKDFGRNGWQPMSMFDQPELERYLRSKLAAYTNITVYLGEEVDEFSEEGDCIVISSKQRTVHADWMLACDGAASPTRKALGIGWQDLGYDHEWLVVDVTLNDGCELQPETVQVCDPLRLSTYVGSKDPFRRWEFKLNPGETAEDVTQDGFITEMISPWLPPEAYTIRRKAVYQFHAATANQWQKGRVFIAGDAAHQTPPFLGQGLNAGMRDVINFAWKLALVKREICDPTLLSAYSDERVPHAQDLVDWAVSLGQLMEHLAETEVAAQRGEPAPELPSQKQASGYGQGREAPPLRQGVIVVDQVSNEGSTGYLFCQPEVSVAGDGATFKLDRELGQGFALVTRLSNLKLNEESKTTMQKLNMSVCDISQYEPVRGHHDQLFADADAAIIRPDRYVFGHTTAEMGADDLIKSLAVQLSLS
jgi:3-(3-hydroxy-phenyl)propionate hydroxylase